MSVPQQGHYYPPYGGHTPHQMPAMQYNTHQYAPSHYNTFSQQMPPAQRAGIPQRPAAVPMNDPHMPNLPPQIQQKLSMGNGRIIQVAPGQAPPPGAILVSGPLGSPNPTPQTIPTQNVAPPGMPIPLSGMPAPIARPSAVPSVPPSVTLNTPVPIQQQQPPVNGNAPQSYITQQQPQPIRPVYGSIPHQQPSAVPHMQSSQPLYHPHQQMQHPPMGPSNHTMQQPQQQQHMMGNVDHTPSVRQMESLLEQATAFCASMDEHERKVATYRTELVQAIHAFRKEVSAVAVQSGCGPSHPREPRNNDPPFYWVASPDYMQEFAVSGSHKDIVSKVGDFEDQGWVIPVAGSLRMVRGSVYRWGLKILKKCPHRPQMQFGVHGLHHEKPWRLITTSRCSRSRDDEPWQDRPGGDRLIDESDTVWIEVDLRVLGGSTRGTLSYAVNEDAWEVAFSDIPLNSDLPLMPVVSMGGDGCAVQVIPY